MKIAVVSWSRRRAGGAERYLANIIPALAGAGHTVALWTERDQPADREPITTDPRVSSFTVSDLGAGPALAALKTWRPDLLYCHGLQSPSLESRVLDLAPAVFFVHEYYGTCISGAKAFRVSTARPCHRRFGLPCFVQFYPRRCGGLSPVTMVGAYLRQRARLDLLSRYGAIVTSSEHMRLEYLKHGLPETRVRRVTFVVATDSPPLAARRAANAPWHLVFAGRMDRHKGGTILLEALPAVYRLLGRPVRLTFAGDGPDRARWARTATRIASREPSIITTFVGWLDERRLGALLDDADLLVVPSTWPEPFGLTGPEAGLRGVPAAAFAVGGIPEWLEDGVNGCLASGEPPSASGLADAVVRCLRDPATHRRLREGAVRAAQRFSMVRHLAELELVFAGAVRRTGAAQVGASGAR